MALHVVAVFGDTKASSSAYDGLAEAYGHDNVLLVGYEIDRPFLLIESSDSIESIAKAAGIDDRCPGLVMRLGSGHYGYMTEESWEWLHTHT